jgi:hypothetical protein
LLEFIIAFPAMDQISRSWFFISQVLTRRAREQLDMEKPRDLEQNEKEIHEGDQEKNKGAEEARNNGQD